ncbi:MAG: hypothetical protein M3516_02355 [Actinomycetota bacterium]|nr:hypothetical protein [Actinomycetota bacterium]
MKREADISGSQRKLLIGHVTPSRSADGASGISLKDGRTLPFVVSRTWSAPAGHYREQWFLVNPESREVLFEGPAKTTQILGLQAPTDLSDEVRAPFGLAPGTYLVVFALGGIMGGQIEVVAAERPAEVAA